MRPCLVCDALSGKARCPGHSQRGEQERAGLYRSRLRPGGSTRSWRRTRAEQLRREPLCAVCHRDRVVRPATEVAHLRARRDGGGDEPENLLSVCHHHHVELDRRAAEGVVPAPGGWVGDGMAAAPDSQSQVSRNVCSSGPWVA